MRDRVIGLYKGRLRARVSPELPVTTRLIHYEQGEDERELLFFAEEIRARPDDPLWSTREDGLIRVVLARASEYSESLIADGVVYLTNALIQISDENIEAGTDKPEPYVYTSSLGIDLLQPQLALTQEGA